MRREKWEYQSECVKRVKRKIFSSIANIKITGTYLEFYIFYRKFNFFFKEKNLEEKRNENGLVFAIFLYLFEYLRIYITKSNRWLPCTRNMWIRAVSTMLFSSKHHKNTVHYDFIIKTKHLHQKLKCGCLFADRKECCGCINKSGFSIFGVYVFNKSSQSVRFSL